MDSDQLMPACVGVCVFVYLLNMCCVDLVIIEEESETNTERV